MERHLLNRRPKAKPNRRRLTDRFVKTVKPGPKVMLYWDTNEKGLALEVQPTGYKAYKFVYSLRGRSRWYHLGDVRDIGLKEARKDACDLRSQVNKGVDVQAERVAKRKAGTFAELATRYVEDYAKKKLKSWEQTEYKIDKYLLPRWRHLQVHSIKRRDVKSMFNSITNRGSLVAANQAVAQASAIFAWAIKEEEVEDFVNPASGINQHKTKARERILSDSELPRFWEAFDEAGLLRSSALKLILLTGQRPGEISHMLASHIEKVDDDDAWWNLPGEPDGGWPGTKNGGSHRVWLTEPALTVLDELGLDGSGFVFTGPRGRPVAGLDGAMRDICKSVGVETKVTPHDLRRTHGTMVTSLRFTRDQMNRIQNHKEGGIADVYDLHHYRDESRQIQEAVTRKIMGLVEGREASNVVNIA